MSIVLNFFVFLSSGGQLADLQQLSHVTPIMMLVLLLTATGAHASPLPPSHLLSSSSNVCFKPSSALITCASGGLAASLVLKHFSSVTKAFATACEMLLTAILSRYLTGTVLTPGFQLSFVLVRTLLHFQSIFPF